MAATRLYGDGLSRPGTPEGRLSDQDRDGVVAEVIYGLSGLAARFQAPGLASAILVAFNDYLAEFCAVAPERLIGLACLPFESPEVAAAELHRCVGLGFRGVAIDIKSSPIPMHDEAWDPLWAAATEREIPVSFHLGGSGFGGTMTSVLGANLPRAGKLRRDAAMGMSMLQYACSADLLAILLGGALDRFPTLSIVLAESGIGWIPHMLERIEYVIDNEFADLDLELRPIDYWHRQMYATFAKDEVGVQHLLGQLGDDRIMFASDYPHPDGIFPDSVDTFERQTDGLESSSRERIAWRNAADLYRLAAPAS